MQTWYPCDLTTAPSDEISAMGYSLRTRDYRYTAWLPVDRTSLVPMLSLPPFAGGVGWGGVEKIVAGLGAVEWSGVEWVEVEWSWVEWSGVEWSGVGWGGVGWGGVGWGGVG